MKRRFWLEVTGSDISLTFHSPDAVYRAVSLESSIACIPRLLYLHPGLNPPPANPLLDKFFYISEVIEGDVLAPVWWRDEAEGKAKIGDRFPVAQAGRFFHHMYPIYGVRPMFWWAAKLAFYLRKGLELHRRYRIDY